MKIFTALLKREVLEAKNGFIIVPMVLAGLTIFLVLLTLFGVGELNLIKEIDRAEVHNLGEALALAKSEEAADLPAAITVGYWVVSILTWVAFPFVIFFSLLGVLYEERRDRSILFWKSMPITDWQEVGAKFIAPVVLAPLCFLGITIAAQLIVAVLMSITVLFQGGPMLELWPLGLMIWGWLNAVQAYFIMALWALPLFGWLLFVGSFANRLPFLWALLVPGVMMIVEGIFFDTHHLLTWIGTHMGAWQDLAFRGVRVDIDGPRDLFSFLTGGWHAEAYGYALTSGSFWLGILITAGFLFAATEMRKRAATN